MPTVSKNLPISKSVQHSRTHTDTSKKSSASTCSSSSKSISNSSKTAEIKQHMYPYQTHSKILSQQTSSAVRKFDKGFSADAQRELAQNSYIQTHNFLLAHGCTDGINHNLL